MNRQNIFARYFGRENVVKIGAYSGDTQWDNTKTFEKKNIGGYLELFLGEITILKE